MKVVAELFQNVHMVTGRVATACMPVSCLLAGATLLALDHPPLRVDLRGCVITVARAARAIVAVCKVSRYYG